MKTYTGLTMGGAEATVPCPDWCTVDHAYWGDQADDMYHRSEPLELDVPRDRHRFVPVQVPVLAAELKVHSTDRTPAAAAVWVQFSEFKDDGLELDVQGVDHLLSALDSYREGLAELRDRLAKLDAERRR